MQGGMMPREGVLGQATRIDPVPADHEALDSLSAREDLGGGELVLRTADGTEISLPSSLLRLVVSAANNLAAGRAVMAIPAEVMLTPTEAAELLGLSRPFVARLLERGDIPSELLPESRHRRIKLGDVLAFQDRRERRSEGRSRIADIAATADLPYLCLLFVARVFIDTNVLFPFSVMDLMLALTEDGIHDVMWSDDLLDEWERVIVRERHRSPDAAAAISATIRQFFADTRIPVESYRGLVPETDGPDLDDNAHMAAAVAGQVESLVTWNGKDFDCGFTSLVDIARQRAEKAHGLNFDDGATVLLGDTPNDVAAAQASGARIIAVATGKDSSTALAEAGADMVLPNLTDTPAVLAAIYGQAECSRSTALYAAWIRRSPSAQQSSPR
jgi:excisionase family DNA binding protein